MSVLAHASWYSSMPKSYNRSTPSTHTEKTYNWSYRGELGPCDWYLSGITTNTSTLTGKKSSRAFTGSKTANFKTFKKQNGYLPTLPATDHMINEEAPSVVQTVHDGPCGRISYSSEAANCLGVPVVPSFPLDLRDEGSVKLRNKVLDQDFNAAVFAAEGRKTLDMLTSTASRLARAAMYLRRGNIPRFANELGVTPRKSANTWLEYKYGWMPLLSDVHGAAVAAAKHAYPQGTDRLVRTSASSYRTQFIKAVYSNNSSWSRQNRAEYTQTQRYKTWIIYRVSNPRLAEINQLGLLNPLLIAWELIPLSFVADWFLGVGDRVSALTAFAGLSIVDSGQSTTTEMAGTMYQGLASGRSGERFSIFTQRYFSRVAGLYTPSLLPTRVSGDSLDMSKLITSAALLRQRIG